MVQMRIDQVGLPSVPAGQARTDGLSNGALVTVTNTTGGLTTHVRLLWVPPDDLTARSTLVSTGPTTWTFSPQAGTNGSYRIECIEDLGLPTESRQVRIFGVRNASGLLVPAANELANPNATLENVSPAIIADSENNEPFGPFSSGSAFGWWRALSELFAGGGGPAWPGIGRRVLLQDTDGTYKAQRIGRGFSAPTVTDDVDSGYLAGSWYVQGLPGEGDPSAVLWQALSVAPGAAVWQRVPTEPVGLPGNVQRAGYLGTSGFAFSDHEHSGASRVANPTLSSSATLTALDEFVRVDTTAGSVVLTLPPPGGRNDFRIKKISTDTNTITLRPHNTSGFGPRIEGGAAGADYVLPGSNATDRPAFYVVADGSDWWT